MTLIDHWNKFVEVPSRNRSWYQTVAWWEARRPAYNVYAIAIAAMVGMASMLVPSISEEADYTIFSAVVGVLLINICYTFGWIVELAWKLLSSRDMPEVAPVLLKLGLFLTMFVPILSLVLAIFRGLQ